ncbi:hypothetical protein Esti_001575 [Eimeria stiedai]
MRRLYTPEGAAASDETTGLMGEPATARAAALPSRQPLFLTNWLLCASDATALLQQRDTLLLAQQLEELLPLEALSKELSTAAATPPVHSCNSRASKASVHRDTADASPRFIESETSTSGSSNNKSSNKEGRTSGLGHSPGGTDLEHAAAAAEPHTAGPSVEVEPQQQQQQVPQTEEDEEQQQQQVPQTEEDEEQQQQQVQQQESLRAASHLIVVEYFLSALSFCQTWRFDAREVSTFLALLFEVYRHSVLQRLSPAAAFDLFKQQLLRHSVSRPPVSTQVFSPLHLKPATDFFLNNFLALLPQLQQLHAGPPTRSSTNSGSASCSHSSGSSSSCSSSPNTDGDNTSSSSSNSSSSNVDSNQDAAVLVENIFYRSKSSVLLPHTNLLLTLPLLLLLWLLLLLVTPCAGTCTAALLLASSSTSSSSRCVLRRGVSLQLSAFRDCYVHSWLALGIGGHVFNLAQHLQQQQQQQRSLR